MRRSIVTVIVAGVLATSGALAQPSNVVTITHGAGGEIAIAIDPQIHIDYGLSYPITYDLAIPGGSSSLQAFKRYAAGQQWMSIEEKNSEEFFNAIETVRFDYDANRAYVSAGFGSETDSLYIRITRSNGQEVELVFNQISRHYDNRDASVNCSLDDMAEWSRNKFGRSINILRSYRIWSTIGINTDGCNGSTYRYIQSQLDSGYVEAGAHSRSHPDPRPYSNYEYEITGNKEDLINFLDIPALSRNGENEYIYTWIAPHGYIDATVDSVVGRNKFLVNRLYFANYVGFPEWNENTGTYQPVGVTRAIDPPRVRLGWGIGTDNLRNLNQAFDDVVDEGSDYHLMFHPNVVEWDRSYTIGHLNHISNRKNIWYVAIGHLFAYRLAQENYSVTTGVVGEPAPIPTNIALAQNYPNPFNPETRINYSLNEETQVALTVYDVNGKEVRTLVNAKQAAGEKAVFWDGRDASGNPVSSGMYMYVLRTPEVVQRKKMLLVR